MENLKALVYKGDLTPYQRALALREFKDMVERLELLEKAVKNNAVLPLVTNRMELLSGYTDWLWLNHNILTNAEHNQIALEKYLATL